MDVLSSLVNEVFGYEVWRWKLLLQLVPKGLLGARQGRLFGSKEFCHCVAAPRRGEEALEGVKIRRCQEFFQIWL